MFLKKTTRAEGTSVIKINQFSAATPAEFCLETGNLAS